MPLITLLWFFLATKIMQFWIRYKLRMSILTSFRQCLTLVLLILGGLQHGFAQSGYHPGYIVLLQGDTVRGFVDHRNFDKGSARISFRASAEGAERVYKPLDIRSFSVSDLQYIGGMIQVETSPIEVNQLDYNASLNLRTDTAFVLVLVNGVKSLYTYTVPGWGGRKKLFYIGQDGKLELLLYKLYRQEAVNREIVTAYNGYVGQLKTYLQDCPSIKKKLRSPRYYRSDLERVFRKYYKCVEKQPVYQQELKDKTLEVGVLAGATKSTVAFNVEDGATPWFANTSFSGGMQFTWGVYLDVKLPKKLSNFSINNEIQFTSYHLEGSRTYNTSAGAQYSEGYIGGAYMRLNTMARFRYPVGKVRFFANLGVSNGYARWVDNFEYNLIKGNSAYGTIVPTKDERNYEFGLLGGMGLRYGRGGIECRYNRGNGSSNGDSGVSIVTKQWLFFLTYRLTR